MRRCIIIIIILIFSFNLNGLDLQIQKTTVLNKTNFLTYIYSHNVLYPDIVYAQALLESASFKSYLCIYNHNLFGIRFTKYRPTTAIGKSHNYAEYTDWQSSIDDYIIFQNILNKKYKTRESYLNYINHKYATASDYKYQLRKTMQRHQTEIDNFKLDTI